jgi:tetratricopeptide (TPR) repeat protein
LKKNSLKYIFSIIILALTIACSTKKDSFVRRNWHAVNTEYNTLYNGDISLQKAIADLKSTYKDNFWETLPIERMQLVEKSILPGQKQQNQDFERAETKATKAIQKHSMNIKGSEKNMQMDEAHLLLGKTRYYDQRFVPALEAFNYILYKYSNSDKIYEAKVWREKTNIRLENDALAVKNLKKLIKDNQLKTQVLADANAILAQAYINLDKKDTAIAPLKKALYFTKLKEEKARYHFILGQLYQSLNQNDSAYAEFQEIIDMKRKSPRHYVMQAHAKQSQLVDPTQDTIAFLKKYKKLFQDRENRPYLDILNYQMASFYDRLNKKEQAVKFYNKSLRSKSEDMYLQATTYKNLATIYFDKTKYLTAGQYYDSTLIRLPKKNREYFTIQKKRENLVDVIKYEGIVQHHDSILKIVSLSENDRKTFFEEYIVKLQAKETAIKELEAKQKATQNNNSGIQDIDISQRKTKSEQLTQSTFEPPSGNSAFYFYNPTTVAYGKIEFKKRWGKRSLIENWRLSNKAAADNQVNTDNTIVADNSVSVKPTEELEKYDVNYYLKQLPTSPVVIDSLARERNFANYQLGIIYKEKFKEYKLSASKFELLLENKPEERLILPSLYNLYKVYEIIDKPKAEIIKYKIIFDYPNTRYALILSGQITEENTVALSPKETYKKIYKQYENQEFSDILQTIEKSLPQFSGDDLIPKFELLKASTIGKLRGIDEYKKAINYVAITYPNTEEGKQAEELLKESIPFLEKREFLSDSLSKGWKVVYKAGKKDDVETKTIIEKINKYILEKQYDNYKVSYDVYTETENFIVIHGISSKEYAFFIKEMLEKTKGYKIKNPATVISSENYSVVQIKKNYNQFINLNY